LLPMMPMMPTRNRSGSLMHEEESHRYLERLDLYGRRQTCDDVRRLRWL
jgi:hypothetical protein